VLFKDYATQRQNINIPLKEQIRMKEIMIILVIVTACSVTGNVPTEVCTPEIKTEDLQITQQIAHAAALGTAINANTLDGLFDSTIDIDIGGVNDDYDVRDEIQFTANEDFAPHTGLSFDQRDHWKEQVFIPIPQEAITYLLMFEDTIKTGNFLTDATETDSITIPFLGKELEIRKATATSITMNVGKRLFLNAGENVIVNGKTITLIQTSVAKATIDVDSVREVINEDATEQVYGIEIHVEDISTDSGLEYDSATLFIGDQARTTYTNGEAFIGEDKDNPVWKWKLENLNTNNPTIGITFALDLDDPQENDNPLVEHPISEGEQLCLPFDYACLSFDGLRNDDYHNYKLKTGTESLFTSATNTTAEFSSARILTFSTDNSQGFAVGADRTKKIFIKSTGSGLRLYQETNGKAVFFGTEGTNLFNLRYKDTIIPVSISWTVATDAGTMTFDLPVENDITMHIETDRSDAESFTYLGSSQGGTNVTGDVRYGTTDISGFRYDTRTPDGIIIIDPESQQSSDELEMRIPADVNDFRALVSVKADRCKKV